MSGYWQCAFVCEGRSDEPLAETLQSLMLACRPGDDIAVEVYRPEKAENRSVAAKLAAIAADDVYDLIFVHRDADSAGWEARAEEIRSAGEERAVPVIPVRMTETWVLAHLWAEGECRKWLADNASVGRLRALEEVSGPSPHRAGPARTSHPDRGGAPPESSRSSLDPRARLLGVRSRGLSDVLAGYPAISRVK